MAHLLGYCFKFLTLLPVKEQLSQRLKSYETRARELEVIVEKLKKKRDAIQRTVNEERRLDREIVDEVKEWIEKANMLFEEYEIFNEDKICHEHAVFELFKSGYLPKPGIRYRRSITVDDLTRKANELLQKAKFDTFSYWSGPPSMAAFFSNVGYESFPSREETMRQIIEELEKPSVRMIGLHGLSGVGKTTLVKEVVKKALEDTMFDVVTMASVTRNPDIRKIQGQIVDMLGVVLNEESDIARAARIQNILKNEKNSTLIILDDLQEKLDFNMLGIPHEIDNDDGLKDDKGKSFNIDDLKNVKDGKSLNSDGSKNVKEGKSPNPDGSKNVKERKSVNPDGSKNDKEGKYPIGHRSDPSDRVNLEETLSQYNGCKILMISESKQVLLSQMEGKPKSIFPVEVLEEKEANMLFKKMAGIDDKNSEFVKLAAQIANKCNGLPMSIVTTARALKNQSRSVWEDLHRQLERQNLTGAPEFSTKLSYDLLEDEELKYTFLLCAHMGHHALIMDLVKYCIGLGLLRGIYTVREARDRVYALVVKLKESGLLSDGYSSDQFTMQDTVRRAALSIAYKENHLFTMTKGRIDDWPDKLERYGAISLHHCDFTEGFLKKRNYPRLKLFEVINNDPKLEIPTNFFKGMKELKVLKLTGIRLTLLKLSISSLTELRMLCLEQCVLDKDLSFIGKLKRLRILSFSGSDIENLPVQLEQLNKLQIFDISNCSRLKEIPSGVISSLVSLEELYMRNTLIQWEAEEHTDQSDKASLSELKHLNQLTTLDLQIPNVSLLPKNLFFDKLHHYNLVVGDSTAYLETDFKMPEKYETSKFLAIRLKDGFDIHSLMAIKLLFERVENLFLEELNVVQDIFYTLNLKGFPYLKHLWIKNNSIIQSLIHPEDREHPEIAFPKLESLYLYNLENMDKICSCELSEPSFGKLKVIKINLCGNLKNVFSLSVVRLLTLLETIEVSECDSLKNIVPVERQSNTDKIELLKFPELRFLKLQSLSEFVGLYPIVAEKELLHEKVEVSKLERMELSSIPIDIIWSTLSDQLSPRSSFQNLIHLDVNGCWELEYLISFTMAKNLVSLQSLFVSECVKMTSIFPLEQDRHQKMKGSIFPKLKNIKLRSMKSLSEIWNSKLPSDSFEKLDTLIIEESDKLVNVFPCYKEGMFRSLCNLRVTNCRSMRAIFDLDDKQDFGREYLPNLQDVYLEALPKLEHVWKLNVDRGGILKMNNLQKIWVQECKSLEYIFPFSVANEGRHNLEYLVVCDCAELREIVAKGEAPNTGTDNPSFNFLKLSTIKLSALPKLTSFCPGAYGLDFPTLNDLSIELCDNLEPFNKAEPSNDPQRKLVLFDNKVINKLKSMQIESRHAKSSSSYMGKGNHRRDNLEELCLSRLMDTEILYSFLHRNPNLISLSLNNCSFEEIVPRKKDTKIENIGVVPKLKSLKLVDLPKLKEIRFEPDIILERIEFLILQNCPGMITVVPSSVSLTHLTNLEVANCDALKNLMSPSTAKSLGQLNTMKVIKCESLMEIVGKGENAGKIVFKQLKALELVLLENLKSFCRSDNCEFEFPSLEKLVVSACYNMEQFSVKGPSTPMLQNIYVVHEKQKKRCRYEGDLNATIQKIFKEKKFFEGMAEMNFSKHPGLRQAWQGEVDLQSIHSWFYSLKILKLDNCEIQPSAIPSNILPYLKSLKELQVRDCCNVEVIFDMNATEGAGIGTTLQLQKLTLQRLPKLMHVWKRIGKETKSYQNLQVVFVGECNNLQTVFPAAVAKNLKKLDHLEIEKCNGLLQIVGKEEDAAVDVTQNFVFFCLTALDLQFLPELIYFYPQPFTLDCPLLNKLYLGSCPKLELFELKGFFNTVDDDYFSENLFGNVGLQNKWLCNLVTLKLDKCTLPYAIPSAILLCLKNLQELEVRDSDKVEVIFDMNDIDVMETTSQLKKLTLQQLSKLVHVWERNSDRVLIYQNLQEVIVSDCQNLQTLFPASLAKNLAQLEKLEIHSCHKLQEIVEKEESTAAEVAEKFVFPCLEKLHLYDLPEVTCFYPQTFTLECPSLNILYVSDCPEFELFQSEHPMSESTSINRQPLISNLKVISKLKKLKLDWKHILASTLRCRSEQFAEGLNYLQKIFLFFDIDKNEEAMLPFEILQKAPNLTEMGIYYCNVPEIFFTQNSKIVEDRMLGELKILTLWQVSTLQSIESEDSSWLNTICEKLHELHVFECPDLTTLVHTVSFSCLKKVSISKCPQLQYLFTSSAAKKLMNLEEITVKECESVKEVVMAEEGDATNEAIKFEKLKTIVLDSLPSLVCFYSGCETLQLSSMVDVHVWDCPDMKIFSKGVTDAESFQGIQMSLDSKNQGLLFHQDLNATVKGMFQRQAFFKAVDKDCFSDNPELQKDWRGKIDLQNKWLSNLVTLKLDKCTLPYTIPSAILLCLNNLQELQVQDSDKVEVIFDMNESEIMVTTPQLKKLTLRRLSNLVNAWEKNCHGVLIFQNLQEVIVSGCQNLETFFPPSQAKNLAKLEKLEIHSCHKLQEIVEMEESAAAGVTENFVFPHLEKLDLFDLPQLICFYTQTFTVEFPALNKLSVVDCDNFELLQSGHPVGESTSINRQPPIPNLKVISKLKELHLSWKHIWTFSLRLRSEEFPECLNYLQYISLYFDTNENEKAMLPFEILQKAPNLIQMSINYCNSTEILLAENVKIGEDGILGQLKILTLFKVPALQSIKSEDSSWLNTVCEKLDELCVRECPDLTALVQTVSFSCLKKVSISKCPQLQYLFTSSTAKKLMNLEEITVKECESMKEIVAKEGDATSGPIQFEQLKTIVLHCLPSLVCFYSGSEPLQLSCLVDMHVWECPNMKIFSKGDIDAESFQGIQMSLDRNEDLLFHQDLNATVKGVFQRQAFFQAVDKECFSDNPELQEDWRGKIDLQNKWLCNLVTLKLDKCNLPYAIPHAILLCLNNLQELQVQDSDKVEVIFDMNESEIMVTTSQLKKLTLRRLSNLVNVWEKNRHGVLFFQNLKEVIVSDCQSLQILFPASLAKNLEKLQKLRVESCHKLQEIVEKEERTAADVTEKFVFPCLEKLRLYDLPEVTCFYPQTFTLECPSLNILNVSDCHKFELFQCEHPTSESTSINRQPLISNLKVISKLKKLKLDWKHISASTLRFRSEQFAVGLNYLQKIFLFFDIDKNEKAMLPFEIFQKAPNLTEMSIYHCNVPEILFTQIPKIVEDTMLEELKILTLWKVSTLQSIESEDSTWLNTVCEKLHELHVDECPDLTTLVHTVSFSCLKKMSISNCPKLQYLFTPSAAKKLLNLVEITVEECESMKEIVADSREGDKYENEVIFGKLEFLKLYSLPKFESFYMGSSTLCFLSLKEVWFNQCYTTKVFRLRDKVPVKLKVAIDGFYSKGYIHSLIMQPLEVAA